MRKTHFAVVLSVVTVAGVGKNEGTVHVRAGLDSPESGIFPTDRFTVPDGAQ